MCPFLYNFFDLCGIYNYLPLNFFPYFSLYSSLTQPLSTLPEVYISSQYVQIYKMALLLGPFQTLEQQYHRNEYHFHKSLRQAELLIKRDCLCIKEKVGLPWWLLGKESACNAEDLGSIPGLGRSPGEGNGYPLQYSGLENSMDCIVHWLQRVGHAWATFMFRKKLVKNA